MRVVHLQGTHTHQAEKLAALFIAVAAAVLGQAQGQLSVTARIRSKYLMMMRTVHRLQVVAFHLFGAIGHRLFHLDGREHAVGVIRQVAAGLVHILARQVRSLDPFIPGGKFRFHGQLFDLSDQDAALGQPQRHTRSHIFIKSKEPHFLTDLAVITAFGLFHHLEPFFQLCLFHESGPVQTLQLRIGLLAAIIGRRHTQQLESLNVTRAHHMRAGAEIHEFTIGESGDRFPFGDVVQALQFELLSLCLQQGFDFLTGPYFFLEYLILLDDLLHLLFDTRKVLRRKAMIGDIKIVIESFVR